MQLATRRQESGQLDAARGKTWRNAKCGNGVFFWAVFRVGWQVAAVIVSAVERVFRLALCCTKVGLNA